MLVPVALAAALAGCAGGPSGMGGPTSQTELAYAALARGDHEQAEQRARAALAEDPDAPLALYVQAAALRGQGRLGEAMEILRRLSQMPAAAEASVTGNTPEGPVTVSVADLAGAQLAALERETSPTSLTPPAIAANAPRPNPPVAEPADAGAEAAPDTAPASAMPVTTAATAVPDARPVPEEAPPLSGIALLNAAERFLVLRRLRDAGMITDPEYAGRRAENIGVLLPYSTDRRPAADLGRPVPSAELVSARLEALRQTLASRALTPEEQVAERRAILDAILPVDPIHRAPPPAPPVSLGDAAERADALERLRDRGIISSGEYSRERKALEKASRNAVAHGDGRNARLVGGAAAPARAQAAPPPSGKTAATRAPAPKPDTVLVPRTDAEALAARGGDAAALGRRVGQQPTVVPEAPAAAPKADAAPAGERTVLHLASYRSEAAAREGWAALSRRHAGDLSGLQPHLVRVDLGQGQGVFWRLNAGPLPNAAAARGRCRRLEARGQYCKTAFLGDR